MNKKPKKTYNLFLYNLVGLAYTLKMQSGQSPTFISFSELEKYGEIAIDVLRRDYNEDAWLILNRDYTDEFLYDYEDLFMKGEVNGETGIALKKHISSIEMMKRLHVAALPLNPLLAFHSKEAIKVLGIKDDGHN